MFIGEYETRNFSFGALGASEEEVRDLLDLAWEQHKADYDAPGLDPINYDDIRMIEVEIGAAWRDGEVIVRQ